MNSSIMKGFSFGLTSGIITTLGLMVGLYSSTSSRLVVIGGIITIAIADALSDALGIHISEEAENVHTDKEIWAATIVTFISKFVFSLTFLIPVLLLPLSVAMIVGIIWGFSTIAIFSYYIAGQQKIKPHIAVTEHLLIAGIVLVVTYYVGLWVAAFC